MYTSFWRVLLAACIIGAATAVPAASVDQARNSIQYGDDLMDSIYTDCLRKDSVSCVKYKLFAFVDKMISNKDAIPLADGMFTSSNNTILNRSFLLAIRLKSGTPV